MKDVDLVKAEYSGQSIFIPIEDPLTFRDKCAIAAMQAIIPMWNEECTKFKTLSELAYQMADEMLEERNKS